MENNKSVRCKRCGACCRMVAFPLNFEELDVEILFMDWASARGWRYEAPYLIIPSICPRLNYDKDKGLYTCVVEPNKPLICRKYPTPGTWLPDGCVYGTVEKEDHN